MIGRILNGLENGLTWLTGKILNMPQTMPPTGYAGTPMVPGTATPTASLPGTNPQTGPVPPPPGTNVPATQETVPVWWGDLPAVLNRLLVEFADDPNGAALAVRALKALVNK